MRKLFQPWKIVTILMFLMIFSSLFAFIYTEQVKLPSENWSNALEIDAYSPDMDFENLTANNTMAIAIDDSSFVNIIALGNRLSFTTFNVEGHKLKEGQIDFDQDIYEFSGSMTNGQMELITVTENFDRVTFISINPEDFKEVDRKTVSIDGMDVKLSTQHATAFNDSEVLIIKDGESVRYTPEFEGRIELAESIITPDQTLISFINMKTSTYKLCVMTANDKTQTTECLYILPSLSAINPVNIAMALDDDDEAVVISTMKHSRFGTNYVDFFMFESNTPADFQHSGYEIDTYEAVPYLLQEKNGQLSYLINFWAADLGRTEIAKGVQAYPNIYKTTHGTDEMRQLTKSERSSVKPSYLKIGEFDYLIHNEQHDLVNKVFISSNSPQMIKDSLDYSRDTLFDIFMRTITTYPALILAGIPPMMTVLLPVMVIALPVLMFKLSWAEQNKNLMSLLIIVLFMASKVVAFGWDIFPFFTAQGSWPPFLASPTSHWSAFALFSVLNIFVYWNRNKCHKENRDHFLKSIMIYILLDLVVMIMFFMPYSIV